MSQARTKSEISDYPVYTNYKEVLSTNSKPIYILAKRFGCYKLRVRKNHTDEKIIAYLIAGAKEIERCLVYFTYDDEYSMVIKIRLHIRQDFDRELGRLLFFAFVRKLKADGVYSFAFNAMPLYPNLFNIK